MTSCPTLFAVVLIAGLLSTRGAAADIQVAGSVQMMAGGHVVAGGGGDKVPVPFTLAVAALVDYQLGSDVVIGLSPRAIIDVAPENQGEMKEYDVTLPIGMRRRVREGLAVDATVGPGYSYIPLPSEYPSPKGLVVDVRVSIQWRTTPSAPPIRVSLGYLYGLQTQTQSDRQRTSFSTRLPYLGFGLAWIL